MVRTAGEYAPSKVRRIWDGARMWYVEYTFKLPDPDNTLPLTLGQKLTLCCLDSSDNVSKRSYYVFSPKKTKGFFSIVAPKNPPKLDEREAAKRRAKGEGDFVSGKSSLQ